MDTQENRSLRKLGREYLRQLEADAKPYHDEIKKFSEKVYQALKKLYENKDKKVNDN